MGTGGRGLGGSQPPFKCTPGGLPWRLSAYAHLSGQCLSGGGGGSRCRVGRPSGPTKKTVPEFFRLLSKGRGQGVDGARGGRGGGCLGPKNFCVPKMARPDFPFCKFLLFPRWSLWSGEAGGGLPLLVSNYSKDARGGEGRLDTGLGINVESVWRLVPPVSRAGLCCGGAPGVWSCKRGVTARGRCGGCAW